MILDSVVSTKLDPLKTLNQRKAWSNRLTHIVFNADLRRGHDGLTKLATDMKINTNLRVGEFIVFVNSKRSALKMYAAGETIAHFKMPGNKVMNVEVIRIIPRFFNGTELKYDKALDELIRSKFKR